MNQNRMNSLRFSLRASLKRWGLTTAGIALGIFGRPQETNAADANVSISNFSFSPVNVTINSNESVIWTQKDSIQHTVTSDDNAWPTSLRLSLNQKFTNTFTTGGTYPYHCTPHPNMRGSVIVKEATANQLPSVTITSPASGTTVTDPSVTLVATATDPDGAIAKVEFFEGGTALGSITEAPYQITVTLGAGSHNITAQVTDDKGATANSSVVTLTVNAIASAPSLSEPSWTTDGKFQFKVTGQSGQKYVVQASADAKSWETIQSPQADANVFIITDTPGTAATRYYRVGVQQ